MIVMGIDPALESPCGAALLDITHVYVKVLHVDQSPICRHHDVAQIRQLRDWVKAKAEEWSPELVCIESTFASPKTISGSLSVTKAMAAAIAGLPDEVEIQKVTPSEAKKRSTGRGNATKKQVADAMASILGVQFEKGTPDHITDATAIAFAGYSLHTQWRSS